jgi:hypothetical protein
MEPDRPARVNHASDDVSPMRVIGLGTRPTGAVSMSGRRKYRASRNYLPPVQVARVLARLALVR